MRKEKNTGGTPALLRGRGLRKTCVSAKRTHFIPVTFSVYHLYLQKLMPFATAFANGFVLEKRTHFRGSGGSVPLKIRFVLGTMKPLGGAKTTSRRVVGSNELC